MRAREIVACILSVVIAAAWWTPARAQSALNSECIATLAQERSPAGFSPSWDAGSPKAMYEAMLTRMARDEWYLLADSIYADFAADALALPGNARAVMLSQMDALRHEFAAVTGVRMAKARATAATVTQTRFTEDQDLNGITVELFASFGTRVVIDSTWTVDQRRAICGRSVAIRRMLFAWGQPARELATSALEASARRWDNYATRGYFQFPWELAINGLNFDASSDDPPQSQWVIAHPAVGLEFVWSRVRRFDEFQPLQTLAIEFGWLHYNTPRSSYSGLTIFGALPSDEVAGVGAMLHLGSKFKAGYVLRPKDALGRERSGVLITTDLAQMIAKTPASLQSMRDLVARRLEAQRGAFLRAVRIGQ